MKDFNQKLTRPLQIRKRMAKKGKEKKGFRFRWLILVLLIAGAALYSIQWGSRGLKEQLLKADQTQSLDSAKVIHKALQSFGFDHGGQYPCDATGPAATVEQCFQQLIDNGYLKNEAIFWSQANANAGIGSAKPADLDGILEPGECSWGYVKGLHASTAGATPVLFDASVKIGLFNINVRNETAIIATMGGSITEHAIAHETGSNEGVILVEKEGRKVDLFAHLPAGAEIMVPTPASATK